MKVIVTDLMVDNICHDVLTGEWLRVDEIIRSKEGKHNVGFEVINRDKFPLPAGWHAQPIPLSKAILEMAGFEMKIEDRRTVYTLRSAGERIIDLFGISPYSIPYVAGLPHIQYLHQLQNIVYLVSNIKLKITRA